MYSCFLLFYSNWTLPTTLVSVLFIVAIHCPYSSRISYSLLCSAVMCLRGARSHQGCPLSLRAHGLALAEGQVAPAH